MEKYIKRIKIEKIEAELEVELYRNVTVIGFDVAEHLTGISIIRTTEDSLILDYVGNIIIPKKIKGLDALDLFTEQLDSLKKDMSIKYKFDKNIIENCFLKFNPQTTIWLARCGAIVYDRFKGLSKQSELIYPKTARSLINFKKSSKSVKGKQLKKEIIYYINNALQTKIKDDNQSDAVVLALSGLVIKEEDLY